MIITKLLAAICISEYNGPKLLAAICISEYNGTKLLAAICISEYNGREAPHCMSWPVGIAAHVLARRKCCATELSLNHGTCSTKPLSNITRLLKARENIHRFQQKACETNHVRSSYFY